MVGKSQAGSSGRWPKNPPGPIRAPLQTDKNCRELMRERTSEPELKSGNLFGRGAPDDFAGRPRSPANEVSHPSKVDTEESRSAARACA